MIFLTTDHLNILILGCTISIAKFVIIEISLLQGHIGVLCRSWMRSDKDVFFRHLYTILLCQFIQRESNLSVFASH